MRTRFKISSHSRSTPDGGDCEVFRKAFRAKLILAFLVFQIAVVQKGSTHHFCDRLVLLFWSKLRQATDVMADFVSKEATPSFLIARVTAYENYFFRVKVSDASNILCL
jgi:hypothetical protein